MAENLREAILSRDDLPVEVVSVPEWGMDVRVRALSGTERDAYEASCMKRLQARQGEEPKVEMTFENMRAKLVVRSVVDEAGARVFTDADAATLGGKNAAALNRLFEVAQRLSGLRAEDFKELLGNSESAPAES
jgi:hypothetical protein